MHADIRLCDVTGCARLSSTLPVSAVLPSGTELELWLCWFHAEELEREFGLLGELAEDRVEDVA